MYASLSPTEVCELLSQARLEISPDVVRVEARDERWVAYLPDDLIVWVAMSEKGREKLLIERRVLRLLETRCSFAAPRLLYESEDGVWDVRSMVSGLVDPWRLYNLIKQDAVFAARTGEAVGKILIEQHTRVGQQDIEGWLPRQIEFPMGGEWIRDRVQQVVHDSKLLDDIEMILAQYESLQIEEADCVLVHTDIGLHNLAFDANTLAVLGIFDYEGAAWADRHHDFRYLVFDINRPETLKSALAIYEPAVGIQLSQQRIYLYNAICAFSFLAYRLGTPDEEKSCGRTLAQDLQWTRWACSKAAPKGIAQLDQY